MAVSSEAPVTRTLSYRVPGRVVLAVVLLGKPDD